MYGRTLLLAAALFVVPVLAQSGVDPAKEILALERQAMDGWLRGDPDPQLAIADPEITYFHIMLDKRIEGLPALKTLFESYRGVPLFDSYDIVDPKVVVAGNCAILTYQLGRHVGTTTTYWNATQVYRKGPEGWRVIHTHWSETHPRQP
jgi:ketosteroid isomerase-like protein